MRSVMVALAIVGALTAGMHAQRSGPPVAELLASAERGNLEAQTALARAYLNGVGVDANGAEALRWARRAADQGHAPAQTLLGGFYLDGDVLPRDDAEAARWLWMAVRQSDTAGQSRLGALYLSGRGPEDAPEEGIRLSRLAAQKGDVAAQTNLGLAFADGVGTERREATAIAWYRMAAAQGNVGSMLAIAVFYWFGVDDGPPNNALTYLWTAAAVEERERPSVADPIPDNVNQATQSVRTMRDAALQTLSLPALQDVQLRLAVMYEAGDGLPRSIDKAAQWYEGAADSGLASAQFNLGRLYRTGEGAQQNEVTAVRWFRRAARQGEVRAQRALGMAYATGVGVEANAVRAYLWLLLAASGLSDDQQADVLEVLDGITGDLTPEERVGAQARSAACRASDFEDCGEPDD